MLGGNARRGRFWGVDGFVRFVMVFSYICIIVFFWFRFVLRFLRLLFREILVGVLKFFIYGVWFFKSFFI